MCVVFGREGGLGSVTGNQRRPLVVRERAHHLLFAVDPLTKRTRFEFGVRLNRPELVVTNTVGHLEHRHRRKRRNQETEEE